MSLPLILTIVGVVIAFVIILTVCYVQAPPSVAYILSGVSKNPRIFSGSGRFKIPFLERLDELYLGQVSVDIVTTESVPTYDFINVNIDAIAKIRVDNSPEGIAIASKNFLNMDPSEIAAQLKDTLQGNMREIIGTLDLKTLNNNREDFSKKVVESAVPDMKNLGIEILSFNIQNITDEEGLIEDLGADNIAAIQKNAKITRINAEKEIEIEDAKAKQVANDVKVESERNIAEKNNELAIRIAELKVKEDTKKAEADAAYDIQKQEQQKIINVKTIDANIEKVKREQVLSEEAVKVKENQLIAEINKQAEADKFKTETDAAAELELKKREAEAIKYKMIQEAEGIKSKAEAEAYSIEQKGLAEAKAIEQKGLAEAKAMELKAEAFAKYGQAAIVEMLTKVLPDVAKNVAEPISSIDTMNIYGGDASTVSGNVPTVIKQTMDMMSSVTGVDMTDVVKTQTINAKTDKNINLSITE